MMDPEARRRARETLRSQLVSLIARMDDTERAATECAIGWGIATAIVEAQEKLDWAVEKLDAVTRSNL